MTWDELSRAFADAVREYYAVRGRAADAPNVQSTIRTNSELVPGRADNLMLFARELGGVESIEGLAVLEAGSGFGALAAYLAWHYHPRHLLAFDVRGDFVETATQIAESIGLNDRLSFQIADMQDLSGLSGGPYDLVIANNSFIYLPTKQAMRDGAAQLFNALEPGGVVLFFQANKRWREPFTHDPLVHWLPRRLADVVSNVTGWKHNHGRVRLVTPRGLARILKRAGFVAPAAGALRQGQVVTGRMASVASFYALAARRPLLSDE